MADAGIQSHSAEYPSAARSASTTASPRARRAATFSMRIAFGLISPMIRAYSFQRPDRAPPMPSRLPALEMSWQGNPPQMTSTASRSSPPTFLTSSKRLTPGQCFARTSRHHSLTSTCQLTKNPARSSPRSRPPIPEKREPTVDMEKMTGSPLAVETCACPLLKGLEPTRPKTTLPRPQPESP